MAKLYVLEIASALIGLVLVVADCRHMMTEASGPSQWATVQRPLDMQTPFSAQGAQMQQADVMRELDDLSLLASAGADRLQSVAR